MTSDLYDLGIPTVVTFELPKTYNPDTGKYALSAEPPIVLEVFFLENANTRSGAEQAGLEASKTNRVMQIVRTTTKSLKLPEPLRASSKGTFYDMGQKQSLTLGTLTPRQLPDVADVFGWQYSCQITAVS